ncbi:hypothetical protein OROGR_014783 [Orobanche gracilis]
MDRNEEEEERLQRCLSSRQTVVDSMLSTIDEVQSYKFVLLVYQIASRIGGTKDSIGPTSFQLLALANGNHIKDKQRSRNSSVVNVGKKITAEDLLKELSSYHGATIMQSTFDAVTSSKSIDVMNGINAPKRAECLGSDGEQIPATCKIW